MICVFKGGYEGKVCMTYEGVHNAHMNLCTGIINVML